MLVKVELLGALPSCQAATYQLKKKCKIKKSSLFPFFKQRLTEKLFFAARWSIVCAGTGGMTRAGRAGKTHNTPLTDICCGSLAPKCQRGYRPLLSSLISRWQERGEEGSLLSPSRAVEKMPGARRRCGAAAMTTTPRVKVSFPEKIRAILIQTSLHYTLSRTLRCRICCKIFLKFLQTECSGFRGFGEASLRLPCRWLFMQTNFYGNCSLSPWKMYPEQWEAGEWRARTFSDVSVLTTTPALRW